MKALYLTTAVAIATLAVEVPAETPAEPVASDESTVLLWRFDEDTGGVAKDSSATARLDGAISGAERVDGRFGKALLWAEENGRVYVDGDFSAITDRFTLEAWIRLDKLPTGKQPFWAADVVGKLDSFAMTVRPPGVLYIGVQLGPNRNWLLGHTRIPLRQWTHVALVYDGPARKIGTFVNGVMDLEADLPPDLPPVNQNPQRPFFVRSYAGTDEKLVGAIDEVCLSRRVKLFGNQWSHRVFLHALRYSSELLLGATVPPGMKNPPAQYRLSVIATMVLRLSKLALLRGTFVVEQSCRRED